MKRPVVLALLGFVFDQLTKWYFQLNFSGKKVLLFDDWGFTYITNPGLWVNPHISSQAILLLQLVVLVAVIICTVELNKYHKKFRKGIFLDLAYASFVAAAFGNIIGDRLFFGYIRDFLITPIAVCNLADIYSNLVYIFLFAEFIAYPPARQLLKVNLPLRKNKTN